MAREPDRSDDLPDVSAFSAVQGACARSRATSPGSPRRAIPVATPLQWDELTQSSTRPDRWTLRTLPGRLERDGDPWAQIDDAARALGAARRRLDDALREVAED